MASKADIVKTKHVKVYDVDEYENLLKGLQVAACMITESHNIVDEKSVLKRLKELTLGGPSDGNCCSCCGVGPFDTREEQISHYKQHWHNHNLKRKLFGKAPLTLGQFNSRQDDDSSVSGSDSETDDNTNRPASDLFAAATRHCKAFFTNAKGQVFCIYRCILHNRKEELSTDGHGGQWMERVRQIGIPAFQRWAVFMVSGGHFAGAIFVGGVPVLHKTMHSYVTRRGQGYAQILRDQHSHAPKSAGASLRRYNQAQFIEHVQDIMASWTQDLVGCWLILYRAVGPTNQAALFGKNSPLNRDDPRVRTLPFPTRKPTYKEVRRVHETVASVEVYETMELFQKALIVSTGKSTTNKSGSDTSIDNRKKAPKGTPSKPIDRAKSRERAARELPAPVFSEDEGPCYIDSETPVDWIKTLSEQSSNGVITNSRKDLLKTNESTSSDNSDAEQIKEIEEVKEKLAAKKKIVKKQDDKQPVKRGPAKIPNNIKKMWKLISGDELSLETIFEGWETEDLETACNMQDPNDGNTALHKAAIAAKTNMVTQLLSAGGDPCIKNHLLQTPYASSQHADTRIAFRLFQAQYPDKYNYSKSQIPGPLTPELLEQEKERKAQQKRAKRQREKEKQMEKNKTNKYLQLTDTEKIKASALERRCFLCGNFLPRKPFEYNAFRFCSTQCLQNHRNLRPLHKSA